MTSRKILPSPKLPELRSGNPEIDRWVQQALQPYVSQVYQQFLSMLEGTTLTPPQITANQNDYTPTGINEASVLRLSTDASRNITGLFPGRERKVFNVGGFDIVLKNADAGSIATNRFALGADLTLNPNEGVTLWYDDTSAVWRSSGRHT